jgi:hypothetical protein
MGVTAAYQNQMFSHRIRSVYTLSNLPNGQVRIGRGLLKDQFASQIARHRNTAKYEKVENDVNH